MFGELMLCTGYVTTFWLIDLVTQGHQTEYLYKIVMHDHENDSLHTSAALEVYGNSPESINLCEYFQDVLPDLDTCDACPKAKDV
jgi:hypothetical protein